MKSFNPNNYGKFLIEECQKVDIHKLLQIYKKNLKQAVIQTQIELEGFNIELCVSKTRFNGDRFWFKCPVCNKRVGIIYKHPINEMIGCRQCLDLNYKSRRYKGMIELKV